MLNLVKVTNNQVTTTSNIIAEVFNKPHKDVLKNIRNLDIPEDFIGRNFSLNKYIDKIGRSLPCYEITRDGFTLLAMGFTGKKAMEWKIKYIEAFNAMERALKEKLPAPIDAKAIGGIVKRCAAVAVREELSRLISAEKSEFWETTDQDLILSLYRWHATKNRGDTKTMRELNSKVDLLMAENASLKEAIKNAKQAISNF